MRWLLVGAAVVTAGCSSSNEAALPLCTPERDPLRAFCVEGLLSATGAERQARNALPEDAAAALVAVESGPLGTLNVDGFDQVWRFTFYQEFSGTQIDVAVDVVNETSDVVMRDEPLTCTEGEFLEAPDTRTFTRTAVNRYEVEREELFRMGANNLFYENRLACASLTGSAVHEVTFLLGETTDRWFVRYDGSEVRDFCGPCEEFTTFECAACP